MRFAYAALAGVVAGIGLLWLTGSLLSAPVNRSVGPPPGALDARTVRFASESGATISAWYGAPAMGAPTVVLSHGVRGSKAQLVGRARFLRDAGYGVLLYDAQGHGESPASHITFGYLEAHDASAAVGFTRSETPAAKIGFIGPSLAGASALLGSEPLAVDALVLESVYPTLESAVRNRISVRLGALLAHPLSQILLWQVEPRLGFDPFALNPIEQIGRVRAPLLVIAGSDDRRTTLEESRALYEAARGPSELWVVEGARHESFHRFARSEYERRILDFFGRTLRSSDARRGDDPAAEWTGGGGGTP